MALQLRSDRQFFHQDTVIFSDNISIAALRDSLASVAYSGFRARENRRSAYSSEVPSPVPMN